MRKLVLFDIDGTLVLTGGAGLRAMRVAGRTVLGAPDLVDGIPVAGRTDWSILRAALTRIGRDLDDGLFVRLRDAYLAQLREEIVRPGDGVKEVMPGVRDLLEALTGREEVMLGLLTGNVAEGARIKLEHFDLWRYFQCGAFGDDDPDRNALVPHAVARAEACGFPRVAWRDVFVIGDTPHDVACAVAVGATPIAVATGQYSVDDLRATGAQVVLQDLRETEAVVRLIQSPE
jgi:phosphoglycolate phosphatase